MTTQIDFMAAMNKGVDADDAANANRDAVKKILARMQHDVATFVGSPVTLGFETRLGPSLGFLRRGAGGLEPPQRRYQALVLRRGNDQHELCEWEEGPLVFPATLRFSMRTEQAFDEESLVVAFADLLATPAVGRVLKSLRAESPASPQQ